MKYLGFVLLVLSGYVMAEEVYYCSDNTNGANGFRKIDGQYTKVNFKEDKFKFNLFSIKDKSYIKIDDGGLFHCSINWGIKHHSCVDEFHNGDYFSFNQDNGRYIMFEGFGYVFGTKDSVMTRIGTCTKF